MKVLLICDDFYHHGEVPIKGVEPLKDKGFEFDIITDGKEFTVDILKSYPVVLLCKCDEISKDDKTPWKTDAVQQGFVDYVENGGGLLAIHTATVAGKNTQVLDNLLGCKFKSHPADCLTTVQPIKPHPITNGVKAFTEVDEHYRLEILKDDVDILIASYSPPQGEIEKYETEPYFNTTSWIDASCLIRKQGSGRVCVLTPGHHVHVWHNPEHQKTLENALNWCGGK